jgi:hypothetical protein
MNPFKSLRRPDEFAAAFRAEIHHSRRRLERRARARMKMSEAIHQVAILMSQREGE